MKYPNPAIHGLTLSTLDLFKDALNRASISNCFSVRNGWRSYVPSTQLSWVASRVKSEDVVSIELMYLVLMFFDL